MSILFAEDDGFGVGATGYSRSGSSIGFPFGTLDSEPISGQVVDFFVTGSISALALLGDTTALGLTSINVNGVAWALGTPAYYSSGVARTEYPVTPSGGGFSDSVAYTVTVGDPPPAYEGPTWGAVGTAAASVNATSVSVTSVRGVGRLMFIAVMTANQEIATPAGWTAFVADSGTPERNTAGTAGAVRLVLWWKVSDGTESTVAVADSGAVQYAVPFSIVPASGATIGFDVSIAGNASGTAGSFTGVTTTGDDELILTVVASDRDATGGSWADQANTSLVNLSERFDNATSTGVGGGIAVYTGEKQAAGATGATTATHAGNLAYAWMTIALKNVIAAAETRYKGADWAARYQGAAAENVRYQGALQLH